MRGKAVAIFRQLHHGRITPAYAGKRDIPSRGNTQQGDHPRVCGEKPCLLTLMSTTPGSPPAYAGKRPVHARTSSCNGDHPRVCGEKAVAHIWWYSWIGSPPRMRGKDGVNDSAQAVTGITPACAGKSSQYGLRGWFFQDHPRVCGEKIPMAGNAPVRAGSPPRMRRKGTGSVPSSGNTGITPAYAGKS